MDFSLFLVLPCSSFLRPFSFLSSQAGLNMPTLHEAVRGFPKDIVAISLSLYISDEYFCWSRLGNSIYTSTFSNSIGGDFSAYLLSNGTRCGCASRGEALMTPRQIGKTVRRWVLRIPSELRVVTSAPTASVFTLKSIFSQKLTCWVFNICVRVSPGMWGLGYGERPDLIGVRGDRSGATPFPIWKSIIGPFPHRKWAPGAMPSWIFYLPISYLKIDHWAIFK